MGQPCSIQILLRFVFLLNLLGLLWARFPCKFLKNLHTNLGRISLPSVLQLLSQRLLLLVTLLWSQHSLKATFKRVKSQIQKDSELQQQMGVFQASMLEAMKSLREKMQSMKKPSEAEVDKTSASLSRAGPSKQPDPSTRASEHSDGQPMDTDLMVLSFHQGLLKVFNLTMAPSTRIFNPTTQILIPSTRNNLKGFVPELRSTRTRKNTRLGQNTILSRLRQRKISPLSMSRSLLNLNRLLSMINNRIAQIQFFTGR